MGKKNSKERFVNISIVSVSVAMIFVSGIFYWLYTSARQNIISMWQNRNFHIAQDVGYYLRTPIDAISFTTLKVNGMLDRGATNEEISRYLINESEIYELVVEGNETGIYGFCQGEYLDSSGWIPPADYVPQDRPWYQAAIAADGKIALVEPYKNLQTLTMMMSVSQLLNDKKSVLSMDIFLGSVQKVIDEITAEENVLEMAMVINGSGIVVAHSYEEEIGKNYGQENSSTFGKHLIQEIKNRTDNIFKIDDGNEKRMVFVEQINDDWFMVLILNQEKMFRSLQYIYLFSGFTMTIVLVAIFTGFYFMELKHSEAERLSREIRAVADIYDSMFMIDLKTDKMQILRNSKTFEKFLGGDLNNYSKRVGMFTKSMTADQSKNIMMNFVNLDTLNERLKGIDSISHEYLDINNHWMRARFIVVERDEQEKIQQIIFAVESIDEDRKRQERLRELSEMDMMTKIRNRGSGEALVRKKMSDGMRGLFCLLDADKFKSINDNFGHSVGDKVIIAIAEALKKTFRETDIVFRLGGDEFAVYADEVNDEETAKNILNRLFNNIEKINIPELGERKICVSVGGTFYPADRNDSFEALYKRADSALYDSKKVEGNFVSFHE